MLAAVDGVVADGAGEGAGVEGFGEEAVEAEGAEKFGALLAEIVVAGALHDAEHRLLGIAASGER